MPKDRWFDRVVTLEDMVARRADFLAGPGCDVAHADIVDELGPGHAVDPDDADAVMAVWFDLLARKFAGTDTVTVHRHMTVKDLDGFVEIARAGGEVGHHWSTEPVETPYPEVETVDVRLVGEVDLSDVDWFSTFQANFSHPWEREVTVSGKVRVLSVQDTRTGVVHPVEPTADLSPRP